MGDPCVNFVLCLPPLSLSFRFESASQGERCFRFSVVSRAFLARRHRACGNRDHCKKRRCKRDLHVHRILELSRLGFHRCGRCLCFRLGVAVSAPLKNKNFLFLLDTVENWFRAQQLRDSGSMLFFLLLILLQREAPHF